MKLLLLVRMLIGILAGVLTAPAYALIGGVVDANVGSSPWAGVGAVVVNGNVYSGVLIGNRHVLTAAHIVGSVAPAHVSFVLNPGAQQTYQAVAINVFPGYAGTNPGPDGVWHDDLAVVILDEPVLNVAPYALYSGNLAGKTLTLVGYGAGGDGVSGVGVNASANIKRTGRNNVDLLLVDDDGGNAMEIFVFDFDGPDSSTNRFGPAVPANFTLGASIETQFAGGDSGSPAFVQEDGSWKVAGIAAFNGSVTGQPGSNVRFGALGGGTIVAPYATWISGTLAGPVPEPHTWLMLLAGLGCVAMAARLRA